MSLLTGKKAFGKLEAGHYTARITTIIEVPYDAIKEVDEHINFNLVLTSAGDRPITDCRFEKGLDVMMSQLMEAYFPGQPPLDYDYVLETIHNKEIDIWVSYNIDEIRGTEYRNINYRAPKMATVNPRTIVAR